MKKMILVFSLLFGAFNLNAMDWGTSDSIWAETKSELVALGMTEEDLDENIPKDYPLEKLKLTNFWKVKEKISQNEKNKLLANIISLSYTDEFWNIRRLHIAAAVMIGSDPNTYSGNCYETALSDAVIYEDISLAFLVLKKGADPNGNGYSSVSLSVAVSDTKNEQLVRLLLAYGADPEKQLKGKYEIDAKKWCQQIQQQMRKEQEEL